MAALSSAAYGGSYRCVSEVVIPSNCDDLYLRFRFLHSHCFSLFRVASYPAACCLHRSVRTLSVALDISTRDMKVFRFTLPQVNGDRRHDCQAKRDGHENDPGSPIVRTLHVGIANVAVNARGGEGSRITCAGLRARAVCILQLLSLCRNLHHDATLSAASLSSQ